MACRGKTPLPARRHQRRVAVVQSEALTDDSQLQVPAGPAAKAPRLSWTPTAEPLGKCSPSRSDELRVLLGGRDPDPPPGEVPEAAGAGDADGGAVGGCSGMGSGVPCGRRGSPLIRLWLWIQRRRRRQRPGLWSLGSWLGSCRRGGREASDVGQATPRTVGEEGWRPIEPALSTQSPSAGTDRKHVPGLPPRPPPTYLALMLLN